ncbi:3-phosphoshikimate 1-carboxyvinyltransferase [Aggregicoccus sp. 17bor-14]|uniref:3-phosphoshikimate 1-carboxyvinyltransferase n=1 Tax=Myxococcaceae TaxID=31 RepID=UPI00351A1ECE
MTVLRVDPSALQAAQLTPPLSKSDAQRALVLAHLSGARTLEGLESEPVESLPADVRTLLRGLDALRLPPGPRRELDCADGGAPFRILLTQAATTPGFRGGFRGTPRLGERPHAPLLEALREALGPVGLRLEEGRPWPLELWAPQDSVGAPPRFRVRSEQSSQYASSLLLGAAALYLRERRPWSVELEGGLTSPGYLELTLAWMARFGFDVRREPGRLTVTGHTPPAQLPALPGDWSSLGYLLLVAWRSGGSVERVDLASAQPDQALLEIVREAGLRTASPAPGVLRLEGEALRGVRASGTRCPDLLPTLAALAMVLPGPSVLSDVGVLRLKESDRLEGIRALVSAFGGSSALEGEGLTLQAPASRPAHFEVDSREDHRLAMSAATLSVLSGVPLTLHGPECVAKSFPGFWTQLQRTGVRLT